MATIILEIPDELADQAESLRDQFQALLQHTHDPLEPSDPQLAAELRQIITVLSRQPTPDQILTLQPSPQLQQRVDTLLDYQKAQPLRQAETLELERYLFIEHLVRLAKAHALTQINRTS